MQGQDNAYKTTNNGSPTCRPMEFAVLARRLCENTLLKGDIDRPGDASGTAHADNGERR